MAENKPLKAREKTVQQMTRSGLVQQNRATGEVERISQRTEDFSLQSRPAANEDFTRLAGSPDSRQPLNHSHTIQPASPLSGNGQAGSTNIVGGSSSGSQSQMHSDAQAVPSVSDRGSSYTSQHRSAAQDNYPAGSADSRHPYAPHPDTRSDTYVHQNDTAVSPSVAPLYHEGGERLSEGSKPLREPRSSWQESSPTQQQRRYVQAHFPETQDSAQNPTGQEARQPDPYQPQPYTPQPYSVDASTAFPDTHGETAYQPAPLHQTESPAAMSQATPSVPSQTPVSAPAFYHSPAVSPSLRAYAAAAFETHESHRQEKKASAYQEQAGHSSYQTEPERGQTAYQADHAQAGNVHFRGKETGSSSYQTGDSSRQDASFRENAPSSATPTQDTQSHHHDSVFREDRRTDVAYQSEPSPVQEATFHQDASALSPYRIQHEHSQASPVPQDGSRHAAGQTALKTEHSVPFSAGNSGSSSPRMDFKGTSSAHLPTHEVPVSVSQERPGTDNGIDIYHRTDTDSLMEAQRPRDTSQAPSVSTTPHYGFHDDGAVSAFHIDAGSGNDGAYQPDKPRQSPVSPSDRQRAGASESTHHDTQISPSGENDTTPTLRSSPGEFGGKAAAKAADPATPLHQKPATIAASPLPEEKPDNGTPAAQTPKAQSGAAGNEKAAPIVSAAAITGLTAAEAVTDSPAPAEPAAKDNGIALNHRQDTAPILSKENLGRTPASGAKGEAQDAVRNGPTASTRSPQKKSRWPHKQNDTAPDSPATPSVEPAAKDNGIALNQRQSAVPIDSALEHRQDLTGKRKSGTALARQAGQDLSSAKRDSQRLASKAEAPAAETATIPGSPGDKKGSPKSAPARGGPEKGTASSGADASSPAKGRKAPDAKAGGTSGQGKAKAAPLPLQEDGPTPAGSKTAKKKKQQQQGATKKASKLQFEKSDLSGESGMTGKVKAASEKAAHAVTGTVGTYVHGKIHEVEHDNSGVEAAHRSELLAERGFSEASQRLKAHSQTKKQQKKVSRLQESSTGSKSRLHAGSPAADEARKASGTKKSSLSRFYQKLQNKRRATEAAKAAKQGKKAAEGTAGATITVTEKVVSWFREIFVTKKKTWIAVLALVLIMVLLVTQLQSCSMIALQSLGTVTASSWPADDSEITKAENYYTQLEANLQKKINTVESRKSSCDEFSYNLDEIGHDPVVLISYLCAKYGDFTFDSTIQNELDTLFALQYSYSESVVTETRTTTKTVRVGESLGEVVTSGYCNCSICCGIWAGGTTASGVYPQANHTIAVDASNPIVPIGTKVVMNGIEYTVEDTGNFARYGVDFDVYYDSHSAASAHGHQTWTAYLSDSNGDTEVEVTTTSEVKVCYVTLSTTSLETLVASRLNEDQTEIYTVYVTTRGNRQFLGTPVDYSWHYYVSSYYGYRVTSSNSVEMHNGLDISVPEGTEILSVIDGTVTKASYSSSYGNYLIVENDDGYWVLYAHCKTINVSAGDEVATGDVIATVGSTGTTTGTHLHIEFQYDGTYYNPYFYLAEGSATLYGSAEYSSDAAAKLIAKAKMYLGTPYVWGGYSPSGFDCSGFVSYAINNCGAGWNVGRLTANGLLSICTVIPASDAKAGDLIFFQGTYSTSGASHVGIYLGDGTMIHAGDPVKISSISTSYWQSHFLCYGRLDNP